MIILISQSLKSKFIHRCQFYKISNRIARLDYSYIYCLITILPSVDIVSIVIIEYRFYVLTYLYLTLMYFLSSINIIFNSKNFSCHYCCVTLPKNQYINIMITTKKEHNIISHQIFVYLMAKLFMTIWVNLHKVVTIIFLIF